MNLYKPIPIKEVPKFISPYQAIVSENWDEGIVGAIMNDKALNIKIPSKLYEQLKTEAEKKNQKKLA